MNRAGRLPVLVVALAVAGGVGLVLPVVGLGTRVPWGHLASLLAADSARTALGLSLRTCLVSTAVCLVLGVPLALVLAREWPGVRVARVLVVLPMTLPPVVAGLALLATFGRRGLLGARLEAVGVSIAFSTVAVVMAQVFVSLPFLVVTLEAALRSRDQRTEEVARTLGASPWRVLTHVTLPLVAPALLRGTALALGRGLGEFGATLTFAGSLEGRTRTMPLAIYLARESDSDTSLALAAVLIVLSALVVSVTAWPWARVAQAGRVLAGRWRAGRTLVRRTSAVPAPPVGPPPGDDLGTGPDVGTYDAAVGGAPSTAGAPDEVVATGAGPAAGVVGAAKAAGAISAAGAAGGGITFRAHVEERDLDVAFTVGPGTTTVLLGRNGSGKSTVCLVLAGLLGVGRGGELRLGIRVLDGADTGGPVPVGRRGIALLGQDPLVFWHMSVLDNVAFGPRSRAVGRSRARARARAELEAVGCADLADRPGHALSGGQAAKVALARALATDPRVLVLDEPTAALDVEAGAALRRLVHERAARDHLTVVLVTHDVADVAALADDVVVLDHGRVVEAGPASRVLATPSTSFTARLTGTTLLRGTLAGSAHAPRLVLGDGTAVAAAPFAGASAGVWTHDVGGTPTSGEHPPGGVTAAPTPVREDAEGRGGDQFAAGAPASALLPPEAVALYARAVTGSPRNALPVTVVEMTGAGGLVSVILELGDGQHLRAVVTPAAASELGLEAGISLIAVVKATQVRLVARA